MHKNHSLFAQNKPTNHYTSNQQKKLIHSDNSVNYISEISKVKAPRSESTPTKAGVTFSDTTPSTPGTNTSSNTETPTGSMIEETDDILFTETLNKVFNRKFLAILTGKDAILKEVRDCVVRDDPDRLREISPYLFSYWPDLSVKHGCVCLDERIAIPKSIKDEYWRISTQRIPGFWPCYLLRKTFGSRASTEIYWQKPVSAKDARKLLKTLNQQFRTANGHLYQKALNQMTKYK